MTLAHSSVSAGKPCAGCWKFPTNIDYNAHEIPIAAKSRQGHASSFIKHSLCAPFIFGSSLDRSTMPTFSHPLLPLAPLAFTALYPPQPCSSRAPLLPARQRWRGRGYGRLDVRLPGQPKDSWRRSVDVVPCYDDELATSGHEPTSIRPLRPSREQLHHSRQR
jgi:hypothetical protein